MTPQQKRKAEEQTAFYRQIADDLPGSHMLVSVKYTDSWGKVVERRELHGDVVDVHRTKGITLELDNGQRFTLPSDFEAIRPALPGEYPIPATGETVYDPDFVGMFTISRALLQ